MLASLNCIEKIKEFEGFVGKAYKCPAGVWTVGYGHTKNVIRSTSCSKLSAEQWLKQDLKPIEAFLSAFEEIRKTQGRFDACVDFCFNLGLGAFKSSTLFKKIQAKAPTEAIQAEFMRWIYANKIPLEGLKKRRQWECEQWGKGHIKLR